VGRKTKVKHFFAGKRTRIESPGGQTIAPEGENHTLLRNLKKRRGRGKRTEKEIFLEKEPWGPRHGEASTPKGGLAPKRKEQGKTVGTG